jgi:cation:H+ antiporter
VRGAASLALRFNISTLVVGLTVVAFGTSAPELFVSIQAALEGTPDITMGNVIGSNICNLALVLGVTAIITPIPVHKDSLRIDWPVTMGASLLLYLVVMSGSITWIEGAIFLGILAIYITFLIFKSRRATKISNEALEEVLDVPEPSGKLWKDILFLLLGIIGLYYGSQWFVDSARELAKFLGVTDRVISITVVALGTSLPELVTSAIASYKKESDLAVGNLLGSNIFNIFSILGFTSLVKEIEVNELILRVDMWWMLGITFSILPIMLTKRTVTRLEGAVLLTGYCVYTYLVIS